MTLKYQSGRPAEWTAGVKKLVASWSSDGGGPARFLLTGPCPRCQHPLSVNLSDVAGFGLAGGSGDSMEVLVRCTCGQAHPGAPSAGPAGCGAEGLIKIRRG